MKKVVLGIMCAITCICSVFAGDSENGGGSGSENKIIDQSISWLVTNKCSSPAAFTTGGSTLQISVNETRAITKDSSLDFSVNINGITRSGNTKYYDIKKITINPSSMVRNEFYFTFSY